MRGGCGYTSVWGRRTRQRSTQASEARLYPRGFWRFLALPGLLWLLALFVLPFWISYLMRMLAWVGLLQEDGYVNKVLEWLSLIRHPIAWLEGNPLTVVLGLAYGYVPFMILPLFAALERIDRNTLEAA